MHKDSIAWRLLESRLYELNRLLEMLCYVLIRGVKDWKHIVFEVLEGKSAADLQMGT